MINLTVQVVEAKPYSLRSADNNDNLYAGAALTIAGVSGGHWVIPVPAYGKWIGALHDHVNPVSVGFKWTNVPMPGPQDSGYQEAAILLTVIIVSCRLGLQPSAMSSATQALVQAFASGTIGLVTNDDFMNALTPGATVPVGTPAGDVLQTPEVQTIVQSLTQTCDGPVVATLAKWSADDVYKETRTAAAWEPTDECLG